MSLRHFLQYWSAKAVFPMEGLPAIMIRSDFWNPCVSESRSKKPEGMPANCPSFDLFSRSRNVSSNTSEAGKSPKFGFFLSYIK